MSPFEVKQLRYHCQECGAEDAVELLAEIDREAELGFEITGHRCNACGDVATLEEMTTKEVLGL